MLHLQQPLIRPLQFTKQVSRSGSLSKNADLGAVDEYLKRDIEESHEELPFYVKFLSALTFGSVCASIGFASLGIALGLKIALSVVAGLTVLTVVALLISEFYRNDEGTYLCNQDFEALFDELPPLGDRCETLMQYLNRWLFTYTSKLGESHERVVFVRRMLQQMMHVSEAIESKI